jgi:hypothetical protein
MTDPQNSDASQPSQPTPPAPPAYGEYAPTAPPAYEAAPTAAPAYQQPGYSSAPAYDPSSAIPGAPVPGKTLGIVAFILSFFVPVIPLVLGIVALVQSRKARAGNGFAIAAIVISAIGLIVGAIVLFAIVVPSLSAAATCLNDPNAIVTFWGVDISCAELLEQSGR